MPPQQPGIDYDTLFEEVSGERRAPDYDTLFEEVSREGRTPGVSTIAEQLAEKEAKALAARKKEALREWREDRGKYFKKLIYNLPEDAGRQLLGIAGLAGQAIGSVGELGGDIGSGIRDVMGLEPYWQKNKPSQEALAETLKALPDALIEHYAGYLDPEGLALKIQEGPVTTALDVVPAVGAVGAAGKAGAAAARAVGRVATSPGIGAKLAKSAIMHVPGGPFIRNALDIVEAWKGAPDAPPAGAVPHPPPPTPPPGILTRQPAAPPAGPGGFGPRFAGEPAAPGGWTPEEVALSTQTPEYVARALAAAEAQAGLALTPEQRAIAQTLMVKYRASPEMAVQAALGKAAPETMPTSTLVEAPPPAAPSAEAQAAALETPVAAAAPAAPRPITPEDLARFPTRRSADDIQARREAALGGVEPSVAAPVPAPTVADMLQPRAAAPVAETPTAAPTPVTLEEAARFREALRPRAATPVAEPAPVTPPVAPAPAAAPPPTSGGQAAAFVDTLNTPWAARTRGQQSPAWLESDLGLAARRAGLTLTPAERAAARELVRAGGQTPAQAVRAVAEAAATPATTPAAAAAAPAARTRVSASEFRAYTQLRASGKTDAEATAAVIAMRALSPMTPAEMAAEIAARRTSPGLKANPSPRRD